MKFQNAIFSTIRCSSFLLSTAILINSIPLPLEPEINQIKNLNQDIQDIGHIPRINQQEIPIQKQTTSYEIHNSEQQQGLGDIVEPLESPSKSENLDETNSNKDKDPILKKSTSTNPHQNNNHHHHQSTKSRITLKIQELMDILKAKWPTNNNLDDEINKPILDSKPDSKSVVSQPKSPSTTTTTTPTTTTNSPTTTTTRTTSLKNAGPIKTWYLTSKSLLARILRITKRYFTLNKAKPVKPEEKETGETAAHEASKPKSTLNPVEQLLKQQEEQVVVVPEKPSQDHEVWTQVELPEKNLVIKNNKKKVVPVDSETLNQAINSIPQLTPALQHQHHQLLHHHPEKNELNHPNNPSFNLQTVKSH